MLPTMSAWLQDLLLDNPMLNETMRVGRRFLRSGSETGKGVNSVILGLIALFYVFFIALIIRYRYNVSDTILYVALFLVTLIVPASIYSAISGERERATWEALILTRLTPAQIIAGKIFWRMFLILVILGLLSIPIIASQMVSPYDDRTTFSTLLRGLAIIFTWGFLLCAFGMWISANTRRSVTSIAVIAGTLLGMTLMFPLLLAIFGLVRYMGRAPGTWDVVVWFLINLNPFSALSQATRWIYGRDVSWLEPLLLWVLPLVYILGAALFLALTRRSLRRLEEPKRRGG